MENEIIAKIRDAEVKCIDDISIAFKSSLPNNLKIESIRNRVLEFGGEKREILSFEKVKNSIQRN